MTQICFSQSWETDFSLAQQKALGQNKPLLLVFSGSDWCAPCIKLEKNIWQSAVFNQFASEELVLYRADFPQKRKNRLSEHLVKSNQKLAEEYNPKGYFPHVVVLDESGNVIGVMGYAKISPEEYIEKIKAVL